MIISTLRRCPIEAANIDCHADTLACFHIFFITLADTAFTLATAIYFAAYYAEMTPFSFRIFAATAATPEPLHYCFAFIIIAIIFAIAATAMPLSLRFRRLHCRQPAD